MTEHSGPKLYVRILSRCGCHRREEAEEGESLLHLSLVDMLDQELAGLAPF